MGSALEIYCETIRDKAPRRNCAVDKNLEEDMGMWSGPLVGQRGRFRGMSRWTQPRDGVWGADKSKSGEQQNAESKSK